MRIFTLSFSEKFLLNFARITAELATVNQELQKKSITADELDTLKEKQKILLQDRQLELATHIEFPVTAALITTPSTVLDSISGQLFQRQLHEFIKNSVDAKATEMIFTFEINAQNQATISIADNGQTKIPTNKLGKYQWAEIILHDSEKENTGQLGGCNLGLATAANFLETVGNGELHLSQRPEGGAVITLTSSIKPCDIDCFSFANYVCEIIHDLLEKESDAFKEIHAAEIEKLKEKYHYPETFISARDKLVKPKLVVPIISQPAILTVNQPEQSMSRTKKRPPSLFTAAVLPIMPAISELSVKNPGIS